MFINRLKSSPRFNDVADKFMFNKIQIPDDKLHTDIKHI